MIRRTVDIVVAAIGLVVLSPVLIAAALAVVIDSPGSPLYGARRIGKGGRPFRMWKFRSMVPDADRRGPAITEKRDSRITRVGRFLRRTKIDELPQLFNLLVGDLTLIGPRPEAPGIVERYTAEQREVLALRPGLTGPGSLYYMRRQFDSIPEGADTEQYYVDHIMDEKLRIDLEYARCQTLASDLALILGTLREVVRFRGEG